MPLVDKDKYFRIRPPEPAVFACPGCGRTDWTILTNRQIYCDYCDEFASIDEIFLSLTH